MNETGEDTRISVLFVCMGNICRSPTAEGIFRAAAERAGRADHFRVDSAGTHDYHVGKAPDRRAIEAARRHGVDISELRARQVDDGDFYLFDHILAADGINLAILREMAPAESTAQLSLIMWYAPDGYPAEVPDPYYGSGDGFERVYEMLFAACEGFIRCALDNGV